MKLKLNLLAGISLYLFPALAFAQMVPGPGAMVPTYTGSGTVSNSPANAVAYFAVAGNKVVGGTVLTFNGSNLTSPK